MCESIENYAKQYASKERKEGELIGRQNGKLETYIGLIQDGILTVEEAAKRLEISVEKLKEYVK
jgi:predicted HTH domain antitoxin